MTIETEVYYELEIRVLILMFNVLKSGSSYKINVMRKYTKSNCSWFLTLYCNFKI